MPDIYCCARIAVSPLAFAPPVRYGIALSGVDHGLIGGAPNPPSCISMTQPSRKRIAKVKLTLTKRAVESLEPGARPWIAWDDRLTGFGVRVQPSGTKAFVVNYRSGNGGRRAPNRRVVIGRYGAITPDRARRVAQEVLGRVAVGDDPAAERSAARRMPLLREAFAEFLAANPNRKPSTLRLYRGQIRYCFGDWMSRPLDTITRRDVEGRFHRPHRAAWLGHCQPRDVTAEVGVPAALRGP